MDRKQRSKVQKLYLIESLPTTTADSKQYVVMGSTGNVYTVTIEPSPKCTCPDYKQRKNRCKHIYFILFRLFKLDDNKADKSKFNKDELLLMFLNTPPITENLIIDYNKKEKYEKLKSGKTSVANRATDDDCPICMEELENGSELVFCKYSCGNAVHKICFDMWSIKKSTCVYCRANWYQEESEYININ